MKNIIQDTLEKIKSRGVTPEPRWKYIIKKYTLWSAFAVVAILGALSFSIASNSLLQLDWDLYRFSNQNALIYTLSLLPYFWIIIIGAFLILTFFELRKTEKGYRFSWLRLSLISIGSVIIFGFIFFLTGLGRNFNSLLTRNVPYYGQHMMVTKETQWTQPENGFLSGSLTYVSKNTLEITDLNNKDWDILLDKNTLVRPSVTIVKGETIKIIGTKKSNSSFQATEIRPWVGRGMMRSIGEGQGMMRGAGHGMMGN